MAAVLVLVVSGSAWPSARSERGEWAQVLAPALAVGPSLPALDVPAGIDASVRRQDAQRLAERAAADAAAGRQAKRRAGRSGARGSRPCDARCLAEVARCESVNGAYTFRQHTNPNVSGKYGVKDSTWDGYGGYARAMDAPESVQDAWAREAAAAKGSTPWAASRSCHGY